MKKLVFLAVGVAVLLSTAAYAGVVCEAAELFDWRSPALNSHCLLEWLWEIGLY